MALKFALCLVSILCLLQACNSQSSEFTFDGWDVVFLDAPANLYSIHHSHTQELLYVFGGTELRLINTGANFAAQPPVDAVEWHQPYISIHVFHNGSDIWAAGPTTPSDYTAQTDGYDLPLALTGPGVYQTQKVPGLEGFILYNVFVDSSNLQDVLAYMVGWIPTTETTLNSVSLGLVRVHVDLTQPFASRNYHFNYSVDVLPLSSNKFTVYNSFYKPHIHYSNASNILIIVDPFNNNVFTVNVGPGTTPLVKAKSALISQVNMTITSSIYHPETSFLYVGYAAQGTGGGALAAMDIGTLTTQIFVNFGLYQSNPRALAFDDDVDAMYVGFSGGDVVIKLDYLLNTKGYQRVPPYFTSLEAGQVGLDHIYFITNEQHSKVVRVNKTNFCTNLCPFNGYCQAGQCQCYRHYSLSKDGASCQITENDITIIEKIKEKGAEVALGVIFAITLILGIVGWVLFWRARKGGYQSV